MPKNESEEVKKESSQVRESLNKDENNDNSVIEQENEREKRLKEIEVKIEEERKNRFVENEVANLAIDVLKLEGDEAMFANRIISRGSDPASLELAWKGKISEPIMRAHRMGPGSLKEDERENWLVLASASLDEHSVDDLPPTKKFEQFHQALNWLKNTGNDEKRIAAEKELQKILNLPFKEEEISGVKMRVYVSDRGFASAYWSGEGFAAVKEGGLTFVGSKDKTLEEIGVKVDKQLSPTFGIIF